MPRLWDETIEGHRHAVREAILDTAWALANERGVTSVKMSQIANEAGIGRATLYKYFPDVQAILFAWHQRQIAGHLEQLAELRDQLDDPVERLETVLQAYALISHHRGHRTELATVLHRGERLAEAEQQLVDLIRDLLTEVLEVGELREDVTPDELAGYCLHALAAAGGLPSEAAVHRLVTVTLDGLRPR